MTAALHLDWRVHARCRVADPALFFPNLQGRGIGGGPDTRRATQTAREWCQPCPVIHDCDDLAERTNSVGIWGGCLRRQPGGRIEAPVLVEPLIPAAPRRVAS